MWLNQSAGGSGSTPLPPGAELTPNTNPEAAAPGKS